VLSILASYDGDASEVGFTISAYSSGSVDIRWDETIVSPPYERKVSGAITHKSAGGNCTHRSFMVNPQYHLRILAPPKGSKGVGKARTNVSLRTGKDVPVNVAVVWGQGKRVTE
jgi:calpain-7